VTSTCGPRPVVREVSLDPWTRWSTSTPTRLPGPGSNSVKRSARLSRPSRCSTTTPSTRRSCPHTRSTSAASCTPSTQMRLPRATRARSPSTRVEPDAERVGRAGAAAWGRTSVTGCPSIRKAASRIANSRTRPLRSSSLTNSPS
jgi:hypothetical protein